MSTRKYVLVVALLVGAIVSVLLFVDRQASSGEPVSVPTSAAPQVTSTAAPTVTTPASNQAQDPLTEAVFKFEEVYNLSVSDKNNQKLRSLTTAEGYTSIARNPSLLGMAATAPEVVAVSVDRSAPNTVQPEPFDGDPHTVSVSSRITIIKTRDNGEKETVPLPMRVTTWTNVSGEWKLMAIQY